MEFVRVYARQDIRSFFQGFTRAQQFLRQIVSVDLDGHDANRITRARVQKRFDAIGDCIEIPQVHGIVESGERHGLSRLID